MAAHIVNTHHQITAAADTGLLDLSRAVAIVASHAWTSSATRDGSQDGWILYSPFFKTDPKAAWYHHGQLFFGFHKTAISLPPAASRAAERKARKQASLDAAIAYCAQAYGHHDWARNRMGDWVPAEVEATFPIPKDKPASSHELA